VGVCIILNPAAKGDKARRFRHLFDRFQGEFELRLTTAAGHARTLATMAVREGFETVVAAGGDGTVNEVLNGIGDEPDGFARCRFGVLPLGTVNVFGRELAMPLNVRRAWEVIRRGRERRIDLAQAEFDVEGQLTRRYFCQMAGAGIDSRAIARVDWSLKKKTGPFAYVVAALQTILSEQPKLTVTAGARRVTGVAILVGNGRLYGGSFRVFPRAHADDGQLDVIVFSRCDWSVIARGLCRLALGQLDRLPEVTYFQTETLTLSSETSLPLELEGENVGHLPARISVVKGGMRVIVP